MVGASQIESWASWQQHGGARDSAAARLRDGAGKVASLMMIINRKVLGSKKRKKQMLFATFEQYKYLHRSKRLRKAVALLMHRCGPTETSHKETSGAKAGQ